MQGESDRGWNLDPQRAPVPPVTTRHVHSDAPDPGAASGWLPPFRPSRSANAPHAEIADGVEPTASAPVEPTSGIAFEPAADSPPDSAADVSLEWTAEASVEPTADTEAEIEEAWLLDDVVDADLDIEPASAPEPAADEDAWDPLAEALQEAVTRADPPFAEDLVRSSERSDLAVIDEPPTMAPVPGSSPQRAEIGAEDSDVAGALDRPRAAKPAADGFTEGLAATLESLAASLRARGFNALDDAFARGDRLESSLALFLAGYRAGRGE